MKTAEREHIGRVKLLPCSCCGEPGPSDAHHIRDGQGLAQRSPHWLVIALCKSCHQGKNGVHGDKTMMRIMKMGELDMLAKTIERLAYNVS
jgi:hypothetical protein